MRPTRGEVDLRFVGCGLDRGVLGGFGSVVVGGGDTVQIRLDDSNRSVKTGEAMSQP
jgi:hypothetical protein